MKTIAFLAGLLVASISLSPAVPPAFAQQAEPPDGARIVSAQVSGLEMDQLSPGLQDAIRQLIGTPLDRAQVKALVTRIEEERPRYAAAVRITAEPDGGARVVFVAARMREPEHQANVNDKYVVESAEIRGVPDKDITADMRAELKALEGKPLDTGQAEKLEARLRAAFPRYDISRQTSRGSRTGLITVEFLLKIGEWARPLRFEPLKSNAVYHSDQGWGAFMDVGIGNRDIRFTPIFALDTADDLVEEYSGAGMRFEARKLGTDRIGASLEWTWFTQTWRPATVAAISINPALPRLYDDRTSFTPMLKIALTRGLFLGGGVSIVELHPPDPLDEPFGIERSTMANTVVGTIGYNLLPASSDRRRHHAFDALFNVRAGLGGLESDLEYTRSYGQAAYAYTGGQHRVSVTGMGGVINGGEAPMFERFTLGDTRTLRGWNKYDISPAGADRMIYGSIEYRFHNAFALFVDSGSVWNNGGERKVRLSTGFGIISGPFFMTLGFPLNTSDFRAVFAIGLQAPFVFHKY